MKFADFHFSAVKTWLSDAWHNRQNTLRVLRVVHHKNNNRIMTACYAGVVGLAFVLALINNNDVSASVAPKDKLDYLILENSIVDNYNNPSIYPQSSLENIRSLFEMVRYEESVKTVEHEIKLAKGDTFIKVLTDLGMGYSEANDIYLTLKPVYKPEKLRAGQIIHITTTVDTDKDVLISLDNITIEPKAGERYIVEKDENDKYVAKSVKDELIEEVKTLSGVIDGNLSSSMNKAGVPSKVVANFINIFAYSNYHRRDFTKSGIFESKFENHTTPDGMLEKTATILYASLQLRKDKIALFRYKDKSGNVDYYDEKGYAMKKTLHRKPLAFQAARISSPFGKRRHPIKKKVIVHWGVDYAAPRGTAIYAGGDGVVQKAGWNGGYGNYVKIRHNSEYSTAYGHMQKIAKGIRPGTRVKQGQIIGYVGSTGLSTGPHLHYEVVKNGKRVNPLKIKAAAGENLKGKELKNFKQKVAEVKSLYRSMFAQASSDKVAAR